MAQPASAVAPALADGCSDDSGERQHVGVHYRGPSHKILYAHARNFWRGRLYDFCYTLQQMVSLKYFAEILGFDAGRHRQGEEDAASCRKVAARRLWTFWSGREEQDMTRSRTSRATRTPRLTECVCIPLHGRLPIF